MCNFSKFCVTYFLSYLSFFENQRLVYHLSTWWCMFCCIWFFLLFFFLFNFLSIIKVSMTNQQNFVYDFKMPPMYLYVHMSFNNYGCFSWKPSCDHSYSTGFKLLLNQQFLYLNIFILSISRTNTFIAVLFQCVHNRFFQIIVDIVGILWILNFHIDIVSPPSIFFLCLL